MKLEKQVVSLELSKKLKSLDVKQDSLFYWINSRLGYATAKYHLSMQGGFNEKYHENDMISAFTSAELGEMLPDKVKNDDGYEFNFFHDKFNGCHRICYLEECDELCFPWIEVEGETEADARAKMLIRLIENKLIEV